MGEVFLSEKQFCRRFDVGQRTAQWWRATGGGPPYVRLGQWRIVYRETDCEKWAAGRVYQLRAAELAGKPVGQRRAAG